MPLYWTVTPRLCSAASCLPAGAGRSRAVRVGPVLAPSCDGGHGDSVLQAACWSPVDRQRSVSLRVVSTSDRGERSHAPRAAGPLAHQGRICLRPGRPSLRAGQAGVSNIPTGRTVPRSTTLLSPRRNLERKKQHLFSWRYPVARFHKH